GAAFLDLVRYARDRGLASPLPDRDGGPRPPSPAAVPSARRRQGGRSVAGLSGSVGRDGGPGALSPPDSLIRESAGVPRRHAARWQVRRAQTALRRSAAARSVSSFFAKQNRRTGPPVSL